MFNPTMFDTKMATPTRRQWAQPETMTELGAITVAWLRGAVAAHPGYAHPHNHTPDPITLAHPDVVPTLIACNQAGFVTTPHFQVGHKELTRDGHTYAAISALQGFLSYPLAETLIQVAEDHRFGWISWNTPRPRWHLYGGRGAPVTERDGKPFLTFGDRMTRQQIRLEFYPCNPTAIAALAGSVQLTIFQEEVGAHDMWPALGRWAQYSR